ncbi:hypothetical protein [Embleya sp. NPDC005575]|uniref:hypothetical protein n=1 Tax=Embleya sp. NPDC005575 TaxID=3156892 RepID=UPI0033B273C4
MLPAKLLWQDPRPIPRDDPQEIVVQVVLDPHFHEPTEDDFCTAFGYVCLTHDRLYSRGGCGGGPHVIVLNCAEHGYENLGPSPLMHRYPAGFIPPLTAEQLAELDLDLYPEGTHPRTRPHVAPPGPDFAAANGAPPRTCEHRPGPEDEPSGRLDGLHRCHRGRRASSVDDPSPRFAEALARIATALGRTAPAAPDEHDRWDLYRTALEVPRLLPRVREAVRLEPVPSLAAGVVGEVLERVSVLERPYWIAILDPAVRAFPVRRAQELDVLAAIEDRVFPLRQILDRIDDWSDWLQLRIAASGCDPAIRNVVAKRGRTKRIRRAASG